jgi:uncharacterized cupin superfamily protein
MRKIHEDRLEGKTMSDPKPIALPIYEAPPRIKPSLYPPEFAVRMAGRTKHPVGDLFGLSSFGVNLTRLAPGAVSALNHAHTRQDEFIYVIAGKPTLVLGDEEVQLEAGMCAGFRAGTGLGHHLENRSDTEVVYLEVGDRASGDTVSYPRDDLQALLGEDGKWRFSHKDGRPY